MSETTLRVKTQADIAEIMNRPRGTISKWAVKALNEGRIIGNARRMLPVGKSAEDTPRARSWHDDFDTDDEEESAS